ncbi:MAG: hypothetical protein KatS3mg119_1115 [Rhodothalassiaceae bacterium]|nr:MAG: hypothetical protein KatS3mg119_1115 [Rhodothalassiaceae bacterium]
MAHDPSRAHAPRRRGGAKPAPRPRDRWEWALLVGFWGLVALVPLTFLVSALVPRWTIAVEAVIPAPPEAVFAALADPGRRLAWEPGVVAITPMKGDGSRPGDTRMLFLAGPARRHAVETVTAIDPPRRITWTRSGPTAERSITITVEPRTGDGDRPACRILWVETVYYQGLRARFLALVANRERRRRLAHALAELGRVAAG